MSITIYCAHCLRPLANRNGFKVRTETCIRQGAARRAVWPSGQIYWTVDPDAMECSTWVVDP